jgi:thiol-disulfide isomerase/thioredoxin
MQMMGKKGFGTWVALVLLLCLGHSRVNAENLHTETLDKFIFTANDNPLLQVEMALETAKAENKLTMVVMGAQWCHDSRALAENFSKPSMQTILDERYVVQFIDVGYLQDHRNIASKLGYPNYFATPTVLIVEPNTNRLLNYDDVHIWQNAASEPFERYQQYFAKAGKPIDTEPEQNDVNSDNQQALDKFTLEQSQRLTNAYAQLGPMLRKYKEGTLDSADKFDETWKQVRSFRVSLQEDLVRLKRQAFKSEQSLIFPRYAAFEWEQK